MDNKSLSHTRWNCQYHIVFIPKYRKKKLYGQLKCDVREILSTLCKCLTLVPFLGISAKVFAHWTGAEDMNDVRDLIDTGFVKEESTNYICLHPMMRDIATADADPAVSSCGVFLDNIEADMNEFEEVPYFHMLFAVMREILNRIVVDDAVRFYGFLSSCFLKYGEYRYPDEQWEILDRMGELMAEDKLDDVAMRATLLSYQGHKKECKGELEDALEMPMICSLYSDIIWQKG